VPVQPILLDHRARLANGLRTIRSRAGGGTGLYDTTLAAYRTMRKNWTPTKSNSIVILTDGQNDDAHGPTREQFLAQLGRLADRRHSVRLIIVGIGSDVDRAELVRTTNVTGGAVFIAQDPARISDVFTEALLSRR
jgi:Ca-activated chloride channel family protein